LGEGLGKEIADAEDDGLEGGGAGAVEYDAALGEEGVEAGGDDAFEEGELVGVVGIEGCAVDAGGVGDFLHRELVEVVRVEQVGEGLLEEVAGAADAGIEGWGTGRVGHGVSRLEYVRFATDCCINDKCCVSMNRQMLFRHQLLRRRFTMSTLLHIDSSPMGAASVSRHLSTTFTDKWKASHPGGKIITRDLTKSGLVSIDAAWVAAVYTPEEARTAEQKAVLAKSDELLAEIEAADEVAIGVSMHNFSIPSVLKLYLDQIVRVGQAFTYADGAPKGLLTGKKATFLVATGGAYGPGTRLESLNFIEPYLKALFGFIGITDVTFHTAGGAAALNRGANREEFLQPHDEAVAALAAA
jgi:FMN-dependent NADH-azoreductase